MKTLLTLLGLNTAPINELQSISLSFSWNLAGLILALLVIIPIAYKTYKYEGKSISSPTKKRLIALRLAWLSLLAFVLAGPSLVISGLIPEKNKIAVLIDTSKSMSIKSSKHSNQTRLEQMQQIFKSGFLRKIEAKLDMPPSLFAFGESVMPLTTHEIEDFNLKAESNHTNISGAIKNIVNNLGDSNLIGMILLTDGVSTTGENPLFTSQNMRSPLYFIAPEDDNINSDLSINLVSPPSLGYLNSNLRIKGELSRYGTQENGIEVSILQDLKAIATITVTFEENAKKADFFYNIPCPKEGDFRYDFTINKQTNELTSDNNTDGFLVKIVKERLNIIALSGKPSLEIKFACNAMMTDPNINYTQHTKIFENHWVQSNNQNPQKDTSKSLSPRILDETDVLILTDVEYRDIKPLEDAIMSKVESGFLGIWILASQRSFTQLGYKGSQLAKILPVSIESELLIKTGTNISLSNRNTEYNFLKLLDDPIQNQSFFSTLPKLEGIYEYPQIKMGAEVLLTSGIQKAGTYLPFMIKTNYGRGNTIFTCGGPIWPFGFKLAPSNQGIAPYRALIVNMIKMLANRREDASVSIELPSSRGFTEQSMPIKIWVSDHKRQLLQNAQVTLKITDENNATTNLSCVETTDKGCYETMFIPTSRGIHHLHADAKFQGKELGKANLSILIESSTAEFTNPDINFELMSRLASETSGICVSSQDANKIIEALQQTAGTKIETKHLDLKDSWFLLIIILLLPCLEWYIRRLGGLS